MGRSMTLGSCCTTVYDIHGEEVAAVQVHSDGMGAKRSYSQYNTGAGVCVAMKYQEHQW
jgi:hypothetical protein